MKTVPQTEESEATTEPPTENDLDNRTSAVLSELIQMEGDAEKVVVLLEKLVLYIKKNPTVFASLKPMI